MRSCVEKGDVLGWTPSLKAPMNLRIFLQRSEYNFEWDEYCKNKTKFLSHHNIPCLFQVNMVERFIFLSLSKFTLIKIWIVVTMSVMYWITTKEYDGIMTMTKELITPGIRRMSMIMYQMKINKKGGNLLLWMYQILLCQCYT